MKIQIQIVPGISCIIIALQYATKLTEFLKKDMEAIIFRLDKHIFLQKYSRQRVIQVVFN